MLSSFSCILTSLVFLNPKGTFENKYFTLDLWLSYFKTDKHLFILSCKCLYIVNILLCIRNKVFSFIFMVNDSCHFIGICHYSTIKNTRNIINDSIPIRYCKCLSLCSTNILENLNISERISHKTCYFL